MIFSAKASRCRQYLKSISLVSNNNILTEYWGATPIDRASNFAFKTFNSTKYL